MKPSIPESRLEVWPDLSNPRPGYWRLFWVVPGQSTGSPAFGYCEPGVHSHRTIKAAIEEGVRCFGETAIRGV